VISKEKKFSKHTALTRPAYGEFHRNEWAIIGTPCGQIQELARQLVHCLSADFRLAYADADHKSGDEGMPDNSFLGNKGYLEYTDKITHHRLDTRQEMNKYLFRSWFNDADAVLVNGNHFPAAKQIVVIDPRKEDSLKRKLDRLTDVQLILLAEGVGELFPFVKEKLAGQDVPVLRLEDIDGIADFLKSQWLEDVPPLYGLALVGGKSRRMGEDKGLLEYHGKTQREHLLDLLRPFSQETFLSCRPEQVEELKGLGIPLPDTFAGLGPMGAILSAFREKPDAAWLVVAVDLPLLDADTLAHLIENRDPSRVATAFNSSVNEFPEPLIAIWEPRAYPVLLQFLAQGYSCPRKALINTDVALIDAARPEALSNVNTPEELVEIREKMK
jgi:molybdopterin-guanine dinucleotide biosynthesis protein A